MDGKHNIDGMFKTTEDVKNVLVLRCGNSVTRFGRDAHWNFPLRFRCASASRPLPPTPTPTPTRTIAPTLFCKWLRYLRIIWALVSLVEKLFRWSALGVGNGLAPIHGSRVKSDSGDEPLEWPSICPGAHCALRANARVARGQEREEDSLSRPELPTVLGVRTSTQNVCPR